MHSIVWKWEEPDLGAGSDEVIIQAQGGLQQVSLDASGRLYGHLIVILEDRHWECAAGEAGEPPRKSWCTRRGVGRFKSDKGFYILLY